MDTSGWLELLKQTSELYLLVQSLGLTPQTQKDFWKNLLALLKEQGEPVSFEQGDNGLLKKICNNADIEQIPDDVRSVLYEKVRWVATNSQNNYGLEENAGPYFWNYTMEKLVQFFIENFETMDDTTVLLPIEGENKSITIETLKNADAGVNFPELSSNPEHYVVPWWNGSGISYEDERKHDQLNSTINRENKLQFTRRPNLDDTDESVDEDKLKEWIRLLMPQYGRRVEIEDLDRNFWVIGQTIAAISNYLFGQDASLPKILEGMTREISEIWENVLCLWLGIAMISQNEQHEIKTIVMPLPPRSNDHSRKFDNIDDQTYYVYDQTDQGLVITIPNEENFMEDIRQRIFYLADKYNQNLCVIPYVRLDNYKHNHYAAEWYPCIYTYHKDGDGWDYVRLYERAADKVYEFVVSPKYEMENRFSPNIYASKQDKNGRLLYKFPFSELSETASDGRILLYAALRTIPEVSSTLTPDGIEINSFTLYVYDAANEVVNGTERRIGQYHFENQNDNYVHYTPNILPSPEQDTKLHYKRFEVNKAGYYLGEIPSWKGKTARITEVQDIFTREAYVIKVGSYMPNNIADNEFATALMGASGSDPGTHTLMRGNISATKTVDNFASTICFYENQWSSYVPERDEVGETNDPQEPCCFDLMPRKENTKDMNDKYLRTRGLVAVKEFLLKRGLLDSPCYVATAIGLTPWCNNGERGIIYWDIGGLCHLYHYIPSVNSLEHRPTDDSYSEAYREAGILDTSDYYPEDYDPINVTPESPYSGDGVPPSPLIYIQDDYDLVCDYKEQIALCQPYIDAQVITGWESPAVYGNIDMDNRQILELEDGSVETVYAAWSTFVYQGVTRIIVCYSLLEQTSPPSETPIELTPEQAEEYVGGIVDQVMAEMGLSHEPTYAENDEIERRILQYDAEDKKLIAAVGFTQEQQWDATTKAAQLSEALHFVGKYGSIQLDAADIQELCDEYNIPFDVFVAPENEEQFAAVSRGGKIISCNVIERLDTFFENYGMCTINPLYVQPAWRQFQLISNTEEKCDCVIINDGDITDDGKITYDVQFATEFNGQLNYFDNRWAQRENVDVFSQQAQVGTAKIKIDQTGYSQSIDEDGHIAKPGQGNINEREPDLATSSTYTGFANSPVRFLDPDGESTTVDPITGSNRNMTNRYLKVFNGVNAVTRANSWKF